MRVSLARAPSVQAISAEVLGGHRYTGAAFRRARAATWAMTMNASIAAGGENGLAGFRVNGDDSL